MKAIILAANQSNAYIRLRNRAKPMMFIAGKMILETTIQNLYEAVSKKLLLL